MSAPIRMDVEDLELLADLVAERVLERLGSPASPVGELVDAAEIARRFGLTASTVRGHADELGVIRLGTGPKPRMRFDPERVAAALGSDDRLHHEQSATAGEAPAQPTIRRRRRAAPSGHQPPLLPIRGASVTSRTA
jgi:hypothetical protein